MGEDEQEYVAKLLEEAGLPLEIETGQVCSRFCGSWPSGRPDCHARSERIIWGDPNDDGALREIDRSVGLVAKHQFEDHYGLLLRVAVPIECKHRGQGLEVYAFPREHDAREVASSPVFGKMVGSRLAKETVCSPPPFLADEPTAETVLLRKTENGRKRHGEQLTYKAAQSLYDCVAETLGTRFHPENLPFLKEPNPTLKKKLRQDTDSPDYSLQPTLDRTLAASSEIHEQYLADALDSPEQHLVFLRAFPVICVDGPIRTVETDEDGNVQGFSRSDFVTSGFRLPGWPGPFRFSLGDPAPEGLCLITCPDSLDAVLERIGSWAENILSAWRKQSPETVLKSPLEGAMHQLIAQETYEVQPSRPTYRSDVFDLGPFF